MKVWIAIILLLTLWSAVLAILLTPEPSRSHGLQHDRFAAMDQGGEGRRRHEPVFVAGWVFGSLLIASFVGLLLWVSQPRSWVWLVMGGLAYEAIFAMMCVSYWQSLDNASASFRGPFPAAVSWLLFGMWLIPGLFIAVYVAGYRRWIYSPASAEKFAQLLDSRN